jgi:SAM-dependent methyltransferase
MTAIQAKHPPPLTDTGERMLPVKDGEVSVVFACHQFAYHYAQTFVAGKDVLDVGCGTGHGTALLAQKARSVLGIDYHDGALVYAREHFGRPNIEYRQADATRLDLAQQFDVVVSFQVIEHLRDVDDFVRRVYRALKPGGTALIITPNEKKPTGENPFHINEMDCALFSALLARHFKTCDVYGVAFAAPNLWRGLLSKLPFFLWLGRRFKRHSALKKGLVRALDLTSFRIIDTRVAEEAIDLLAVCVKEKLK